MPDWYWIWVNSILEAILWYEPFLGGAPLLDLRLTLAAVDIVEACDWRLNWARMCPRRPAGLSRVYAFLLVQGELRRIGSYSSSHLVFKGRFSGHEMDVGSGRGSRRYLIETSQLSGSKLYGLILRFHCMGDLGVRTRPRRSRSVLVSYVRVLTFSCSSSFDRLNF